MEITRAEPQPAPAKPYGSPAYCWYVVAVMTLVYACHSMDRAMPMILIEPVRHEFGLSDSQLGLFSGLGFGVAFALAVLPMGYISDRANRRNFLAVILLFWSVFTALGGMAKTYGQLVLTRVGVGAAESGAAPVTMPLISDIFPQNRRAFALGIFYMGVPFGGLVASVVGGWVAAEHGWRAAFFLAGIPGIVLALLLLFTVREPQRGGAETQADESGAGAPKLIEVGAFLIRKPALLFLMPAGALIGLIAITLGAWTGSFFIRVHGLDLKQAGLLLGLGGGLCSLLGPPAVGWLADRLGRRSRRWPLRLVWMMALVGAAAGLAMLFSAPVWLAIVGYVLGDLTRSCYAPVLYSIVMDETPVRMRGTVMSAIQLTTNLIGFGLGPVVVGFLSDFYGGGTAIRYAMADTLVIYGVVVVLILIGSHLLYGRGRAAPAAA